MTECVSGMQEVLFIATVITHRTWEEEGWVLEVQGHSKVHNELEASLSYMRSYPNIID